MPQPAIGTDTGSNRRWLRRVWRLFVYAAVLTIVASIVGLLVLRRQWDRHLEQTVAWYEENTGPLNIEAYGAEAVSDAQNLGYALEEIAEQWSEYEQEPRHLNLALRYFDLLGTDERAAGEPVLTSQDLARASDFLNRRGAMLESLDRLATLERTRLEPLTPWQETPDWFPTALLVARLRLLQTALALEQGDCRQASLDVVAIERIAAVLGAEPNLFLHILGMAAGSLYFEAVQSILEAALAEECLTRPDLTSIEAASNHLNDWRSPLSRTLSAEGTLVMRPEHRASRLLARLGGENWAGLRSLPLLAYARWSSAARASTSPAAAPPAPELPWPARSAAIGNVMADLLAPNIHAAIDKEHRWLTTRDLTQYLMLLVRCDDQESCDPDALPLPVSSATEEAAALLPNEAGGLFVSFAHEVAGDSATALRDRELLTIELPAAPPGS